MTAAPDHSGTPGWVTILGFAAAYNVVQAGRRRELLSEACRRHRRNHPVLIPLAALGLWAHLMGWLDHRIDPLYQLGVAAERLADLIPRPRRNRSLP